ncbi:hypothetical protein VCV18_007769 [Metarhizium anisopliae]
MALRIVFSSTMEYYFLIALRAIQKRSRKISPRWCYDSAAGGSEEKMNTKAIYDAYSVQSTRAVDTVPSLHGATDGSRPRQDDGGEEELATRCSTHKRDAAIRLRRATLTKDCLETVNGSAIDSKFGHTSHSAYSRSMNGG